MEGVKVMSNKKMIEKIEKVIAKIARREAIIEANTTCPFLGYQIKEPSEVKKLRKF